MSLQGGIYFVCCHPPAGSSSALSNPLLGSFSSLSAAIWKAPTGTDKWGFNPVLVWGRFLDKVFLEGSSVCFSVSRLQYKLSSCQTAIPHRAPRRRALHVGASNVQLLQSTYRKISYSRVLSWLWPVVSVWAHNLEQHWEKECFSYSSIGNINFSQGEAVGG